MPKGSYPPANIQGSFEHGERAAEAWASDADNLEYIRRGVLTIDDAAEGEAEDLTFSERVKVIEKRAFKNGFASKMREIMGR